MTMKKSERKAQYIKIINAMGKGQHEKAWDEIMSLTADDAGLFIMGSYKDIIGANKGE